MTGSIGLLKIFIRCRSCIDMWARSWGDVGAVSRSPTGVGGQPFVLRLRDRQDGTQDRREQDLRMCARAMSFRHLKP
jgi:hypothetical protein